VHGTFVPNAEPHARSAAPHPRGSTGAYHPTLPAEPTVPRNALTYPAAPRPYLPPCVIATLGVLATHDADTALHSERVTRLTTGFTTHLQWSDADVHAASVAAALHDIGKLSVCARLLRRAGPLTLTERARMQRHAADGATRAAQMPGVPSASLRAIRSHHERWDGAGYPDGLSAHDIPVLARVIAITDAYDALTSARAYKAPMPPQAALSVLDGDAARQFDPALLRRFGEWLRDAGDARPP